MTSPPEGNPNRAPSLHQRLMAIEAAIQPVKPTGSNEYKKPALSIGDVEDALRPLFAEHRVLTRWRRKQLERMEPRLWRAELVIRMTNADDPEDHFEEEWEDVGSNPSAAYSFTRKGYYKALFHLAEDEEEEGKRQTGDGRPKTQQEPPATRPVPRPVDGQKVEPPSGELDPDERVCPKCGKAGTLHRKADDRERAFCAAGKGGCGKTFPASEVITRAEWFARAKEQKEAPEATDGQVVPLPLGGDK